LKVLSFVGTAAMLWVGGGIIVHGLEHFHWTPIPHVIEGFAKSAEHVPGVGAATGWLAFAVGSAIVGFVIGGVIVAIIHFLPKRKH
jgi:predicted DNA repair protein MutK